MRIKLECIWKPTADVLKIWMAEKPGLSDSPTKTLHQRLGLMLYASKHSNVGDRLATSTRTIVSL